MERVYVSLVALVEKRALLQSRALRVADGELVGPDHALRVLEAAPHRGARVPAVLGHDVVVEVELRAALLVALLVGGEADDALQGLQAGFLRRLALAEKLQ